MAPRGQKKTDIQMLIAVCEQLDKVDTKKLGAFLGCTPDAAYHRYHRFMNKAKGEGAGGSDFGGKAAGSKEPKRKELSENEAESSPKKKPRVQKPAAAKAQVAAKPEANDDEEA